MAYETTPDYGGYERQRGDVDYQYGTQAANNAYGRFISQQRGSRSLGDMQQNFQRQTPLYKSQFTQRGLSGGGITSGTMQNSMRNYLGDYGRDFGRQLQDTTQELQQYDLNQNDLTAWRDQQYTNIEAQRARDLADKAAQIEWLRSIVGGI